MSTSFSPCSYNIIGTTILLMNSLVAQAIYNSNFNNFFHRRRMRPKLQKLNKVKSRVLHSLTVNMNFKEDAETSQGTIYLRI